MGMKEDEVRVRVKSEKMEGEGRRVVRVRRLYTLIIFALMRNAKLFLT